MTLIPITERSQYCFADCGKETCECKPSNRIEMDKEKTAMQMLIEEIDHKLDTEISDTFRHSLEECKKTAKHLLQKEQEQIENAFHFGYLDGIGEDVGLDKYKDALGKDYYQYKYGGENVDR